MVFKNEVKNIQAAGYNGAHTVYTLAYTTETILKYLVMPWWPNLAQNRKSSRFIWVLVYNFGSEMIMGWQAQTYLQKIR